MLKPKIIAFVLAALSVLPSFSQSRDAMMQRADKLRLTYDFKAAATIYSSLLDITSDPVEKNAIMEKIALCENGHSMLSYATKPETVKKITVPAKDFHLWYSHITSWRKLENGDLLLYSDNDRKIVYSSMTEDGKSQLLQSEKLNDTLWSTPAFLGEAFISAGNETLPIISADKKQLYFSSNGLYGMGGYDIFVSTYNESEKEWGVPENLGFPFSSPYDDFLFSTTPDKAYSLFASNRDCSQDSMTIYVLRYDSNPVKVPLADLREIREIAAMKITDSEQASDNGTNHEDDAANDLFSSYSSLLVKYRAAKDSLENKELNDAQTQSLILRMGTLSEQIFDMEMEFLMQGKIVNADDFAPKESKSVAESSQPFDYIFEKQQIGAILHLNFEIPEDLPDYTFRIQDTTMLISDFELPNGIVYQIQLSVTSAKSAANKFKGISPVFETFNKSGKYLYTAGLFTKYEDALSNLAKIKRSGFQSAFIIAYNNGKSIGLNAARTAEKQKASEQKCRIVFNDYADGIPAAILSLIRTRCNKDIARAENNGVITYIIAPFDSRAEASELVDLLVAGGAQGITIEDY